MAYDDLYRISVHAVITNEQNEVLQLRQTYDDKRWGLPGGALEKGETVHEALIRECYEELNCEIDIEYTSGMYYHAKHNSHVIICRCKIRGDNAIKLSDEHSEYKYFALEHVSDIQKQRVNDCIEYSGKVVTRSFT